MLAPLVSVYMRTIMNSIGVVATSLLFFPLATGACSTGTGDPIDVGRSVTPVNPPPLPGGTTPAPSITPPAPGPSTPGTPSTGAPPTPPGGAVDARFGNPIMGGSGETNNRWQKADITRDGQNYYLMANGWGPNFTSQTIAWDGTSFTVKELQGSQGDNYEPATYPTVFCGVYSDSASKACGLPAALDTINSLKTGWSWKPAADGSNGEYNAAYDIWLGSGPSRSNFTGFFMVWLREPPGQQPAGSLQEQSVSVPNVPGVWDIWTGQVNGAPIINYVRAEGADTLSLEFDALDFIDHAQANGYEIPGTHVLSVAVGFEIWNGPVTDLVSHDFYVHVE